MKTLRRELWFWQKHQTILTLYNRNQESFPRHCHEFFEVVFVLGGTAIQHSVGGVRRLQRGAVVVVPPGVWHAYEKCTLELYNCLISPEIFKRELSWLADDPMLSALFFPHPPMKDCCIAQLSSVALKRCRSHLEYLYAMRYSIFENTRPLQISYLLLVMHEVAQTLFSAGTDVHHTPSTLHVAVRRAIELIETEYTKEWTLPQLAEKLGINHFYLSRLFRSKTGLSPMRYLSRKRAETAARMLVGTDMPISQIAEHVGWPEAKIFARCFKGHFEMSASQYRLKSKLEQRKPDLLK